MPRVIWSFPDLFSQSRWLVFHPFCCDCHVLVPPIYHHLHQAFSLTTPSSRTLFSFLSSVTSRLDYIPILYASINTLYILYHIFIIIYYNYWPHISSLMDYKFWKDRTCVHLIYCCILNACHCVSTWLAKRVLNICW